MPANNAPSASSRTSSLASADTPSTTSATQHHNHNHNNAALRAAATAFGRQEPPPRAPPNQLTGSAAGKGAPATAACAGPRGKSPRRQQVPASTTTAHDRSPSHSRQAAVLATARAKPSVALDPAHQTMRSSSRWPATGPKPRGYGEHCRAIASDAADKPTDHTPIAPTTSLVSLFEERSRTATTTATTPHERPELVDLARKTPGGITSMIQLELEGRNGTEPAAANATRTRQLDGQGHSSEDSYASASEDLNASHPSPNRTRSASRARSHSLGDRLRLHHEAKRRPKPSPGPSQHPLRAQPTSTPQQQQHLPRPLSTQSTGMSASSARSHMSIPAQYNAANPRRMTPLRTGDELANALVASSLASSRAPSPTRLEPPPIPSRRRYHKLSFSRTPSPTKSTKSGMMHTLRKKSKSSSSESEDDKHPYHKHHKKRLVRKHPNKHHEGDRKRWRDAITDRERRRYEGVWAANKGLHYSFSLEEQEFIREYPTHDRTQNALASANDSVSNVVARDIWNRSRLPDTVLELVWDLVDDDRVGRLCREQFVIGMWLIDQRLKGRKLPTRVSQSVWDSVRGIGIKVKQR